MILPLFAFYLLLLIETGVIFYFTQQHYAFTRRSGKPDFHLFLLMVIGFVLTVYILVMSYPVFTGQVWLQTR